MEDSIVDIDEALSDSFSQSNDELFEDEVNAIVQQWKHSADGNSPSSCDDKYLNTRTFTRPKRRVYPKCTPNLFATPQQQQPQQQHQPQQSPPAFATPSSLSSSIQLKIGGLVTNNVSSSAQNMQRSFLGDISPPSSMCSTSFTSATSSVVALDAHQMAASLINSNDFTGLDGFMLDAPPTGGHHFNEIFDTSRPQVFDDISMLNAPYSDSNATHVTSASDDDAPNETTIQEAGATAATTHLDDTFAQLTVQMAADSFIMSDEPSLQFAQGAESLTSIGGDATFVDTLTANGASLDASNLLNETYDNNTLTNRTLVVMDAVQPLNVTVDAVPSVTATLAVAVSHEHHPAAVNRSENDTHVLETTSTIGAEAGETDTWGRTLNDTFQLDQIQMENDCTFDMDSSKQQIASAAAASDTSASTHAVSSDNNGTASAEQNYGLQSTPIKAPVTTRKDSRNELTGGLPHISPITHTNANSGNKFHTYVRPKQRTAAPVPSFDIEDIEDETSMNSPGAVQTTPSVRHHAAANAQRDFDERQSLTNFEEFEKSLSMCQTDHDFDDMLNGMAGGSAAQSQQRSRTDAQMRQSLDHIKKRHSLLNLEKQLDDQRRQQAHAATAAADAAAAATATAFNSMMGVSTNSDSNRCLQSSAHLTSSMLLSTSGSGERLLRRSRVTDEYASPARGGAATMMMLSSSSTSSMSDSKENVHSNIDSNRNERDCNSNSTATAAADSNAMAAAGAAGDSPLQLKPRSIPNNRDRFKTMRISKRPPNHEAVPHIPAADSHSGTPSDVDENGAAEGQEDDGIARNTNREASPAMPPPTAVPRRRLTRPSQLSGLTVRRDASLTIGLQRPQPTAQPYHEPMTNAAAVQRVQKITSPMGTKAKSIHNLVDRTSAEKSADETNARSQKERSDPVFKLPTSTQRGRSIARPTGLMRPSSGFYSYGVRRNDSDTESGRMSPTNSLSSGSSKGSLYRLETDTASSADDAVRIELMAVKPPAPNTQQSAAATADVGGSKPQPPTSMLSKRSGIQPPSASGAFAAANRKRSGLPRPMSLANR